MPRIFLALAQANRAPIENVLARTPELPPNGQWATFLRNHDELTLEMVTPDEREVMWNFYAPDPRARLNLGIRRRLAPLLANDARAIKVINSILLTLIGSPVLYYGDEIGMGDNIWLDDRDGVRTPMQWDTSPNAGFSTAPQDQLDEPLVDDEVYGYQCVNVQAQQADPDSLLNALRHMLDVRKQHPAFGRGDFAWIEVESKAIAAYWRTLDHDRVLAIHNLSGQTQSIKLVDQAHDWIDLLSHSRIKQHAALAPYQFLWLAEA
jgi:maltose alpha-D-glucosyltransferase/alpha-amylase